MKELDDSLNEEKMGKGHEFKYSSSCILARSYAYIVEWKSKQGKELCQGGKWISKVDDERKDSKHGGKEGTAGWNICTNVNV